MSKEDTIEDSSAPLVEHLAELRNRLIWSVLAFVIAMLVAFPFAKTLLGFLLKPIEKAMRDPDRHLELPTMPALESGAGWTIDTIHHAISQTSAVRDGSITLDLIEGAEPSLHLQMQPQAPKRLPCSDPSDLNLQWNPWVGCTLQQVKSTQGQWPCQVFSSPLHSPGTRLAIGVAPWQRGCWR